MTTHSPTAHEPVLRLGVEIGQTDARRIRDRMPAVCYRIERDGHEIGSGHIRMDVERPRLDVADASIGTVVVEIALSRVADEQAWLAELLRVLRPGGMLMATFPAGGKLAWLDAQNLYRYLTDVTGRGQSPTATMPTGWNRHYFADELRDLVAGAGFAVRSIRRSGVGLPEPPYLAGLVVGDFLLGRQCIERALYPRRRPLERLDRDIRIPGLGTTLTIEAVRPDSDGPHTSRLHNT